MQTSSRHSDDTPPSQCLDLLRQQLLLLVAVAQLAVASIAPAPDGSVGGDGEAVRESRRDRDDALISQGLDLPGQQLPLILVAVAQPAIASPAPAPGAAVGGESDAVALSSRHAHGALAAQRGGEARRRVELRVTPSPWPRMPGM